MATFLWDFGFDFGAVQQINTQSYLHNAISLDGVAAFPQGIILGDTINFRLFDIAEGASVGDDVLLVGVSFSFTNALAGQLATNPFAATPTGPLGPSPGVGTSPIFSPVIGIPKWELGSADAVNSGRFLFTIGVILQGDASTNVGTNNVRTFVVDPEMIVEAPPSPAT